MAKFYSRYDTDCQNFIPKFFNKNVCKYTKHCDWDCIPANKWSMTPEGIGPFKIILGCSGMRKPLGFDKIKRR